MKKALPWLVLIAILYIAISISKSQWNPFRWFSGMMPPPKPGGPKDGDPCKVGTEVGQWQNGVCITPGGPGNPGGGNAVGRILGAIAPQSIIVPQSTALPYRYMGCQYGNPVPFGITGSVVIFKISCP